MSSQLYALHVSLLADQGDEPHYETMGEGDKSKDKEGADDR